jgi:hypothetical protein
VYFLAMNLTIEILAYTALLEIALATAGYLLRVINEPLAKKAGRA